MSGSIPSSQRPKKKTQGIILTEGKEASDYQDHLLDFDNFKKKKEIKFRKTYFDIVKEKTIHYHKSLHSAMNSKKKDDEESFCTMCEFINDKNGKSSDEAEIQKEFFHEIDVYIKLKPHTGICKFYGYYLIPQKTILAEHFPNGSLLDIYSSKSLKKRLTNLLKAKVIFGTACAMMHLHANKIFHGNLQPSQIYFDSNWEPQITGYASFYPDHLNADYTDYEDEDGFKESFLYTPPEIVNHNFDSKSMKKADVFSFAVVIYTIITNGEKNLIELLDDEDFYEKYLSGDLRPEFPDDVNPLLKGIITKSWDPDPAKRPLFSQIIKALQNEKNIFPDLEIEKYQMYQDQIFENIDIPREDIKLLTSPKIPPKKPAASDTKATAAKGPVKKLTKKTSSDVILHEKPIEDLTSDELEGNEDFAKILEKAQDGQTDAMVSAGYALHKGNICAKNDALAVQFYKKAAENKSQIGMYNYAMLMSAGCGTEKNEKAAMELMKKATGIEDIDNPDEEHEKWYSKAIVTYAQMLQSHKEDDEAEKYYKAAMNLHKDNDGDSFYLYGKFLEAKGDINGALKQYLRADKKGNKLAANDYAVTLLTRKEGDDVKKAIEQLKRASKHSQPVAATNYGKILYYGQYGQVPNKKKAVELFRSAAKKDFPEACFMYAYAISHDNGLCSKPKDDAKVYFQKAADQGHTIAMVQLAKLLQAEGKDDEAAAYLKKGADLKDPMALFKYGECLEKGTGVKRNKKQAMKYYQESAKLGNKLAQSKLADAADDDTDEDS